jgi:hypothetical protein
MKKKYIRNYWEDQLALYQTKRAVGDHEAMANVLRAVNLELQKPGIYWRELDPLDRLGTGEEEKRRREKEGKMEDGKRKMGRVWHPNQK